MAANAKNSISSYELHRAIGVTQKSAWFMIHRVHLAMQGEGDDGNFSGTVEADETFIGGKARNMHHGKRKAKGRGAVGKAVVMGNLERSENKAEKASKVKGFVVNNTKRKTLAPIIRENVEAGSVGCTDALASYAGLDADFAHCFAAGSSATPAASTRIPKRLSATTTPFRENRSLAWCWVRYSSICSRAIE